MGVLFDYTHSKFTRRVLQKMAEIACPKQLQELQLEQDVLNGVELAFKSLPFAPRQALLTGIRAFENGARFVPRHLGKSFSQLKPHHARAYFQFWQSSPLPIQKQFIKGIRGLICIAYYDIPAVGKSIGYTPSEWAAQSTQKRLQQFTVPILQHEKSLISPDPLPLYGNPQNTSKGDPTE